ncbi:MAG TPA: Rieske 2Fe-2S domain-containing protein [Caulobacter sp.]|nr:Rieske 2Fe-2S domain-containing protein [Caulobacter sp.]
MEGLNPARPAAGVLLCRLDEIPDPGSRAFHFREDDKLFLGFVVRRGERLYGFVDSCPHTGQPLAGPTGRYATRENDLILCSGHGALFRIGDGMCTSGPCEGQRLAVWAVEVREGQVVTA